MRNSTRLQDSWMMPSPAATGSRQWLGFWLRRGLLMGMVSVWLGIWTNPLPAQEPAQPESVAQPPATESELEPADPAQEEPAPPEPEASPVLDASERAVGLGAVPEEPLAEPAEELEPQPDEDSQTQTPAPAGEPAPPEPLFGPEVLKLTPDPPVITLRTLNNLQFDRLRIVIDLTERRLRLFSGEEEAIDTPVKVGVSEAMTPLGNHEVIRMSREFFDPNFGSFVRRQDRQVLLSQVDRRYHYLPSDAIFQPQPKQLFIQFAEQNDRPIGLRAGTVNGFTGTRGDVVVPRDVAAILFGSIRRGVPIIVEY